MASQRLGDGPPDALRRAGHDRHFSFKRHLLF